MNKFLSYWLILYEENRREKNIHVPRINNFYTAIEGENKDAELIKLGLKMFRCNLFLPYVISIEIYRTFIIDVKIMKKIEPCNL